MALDQPENESVEGTPSDLQRVFSSSGIYAAGAIAQRSLAFILLPIYTRHIEPAQYGALELLNAFSSILFLFLLLGLDSAVNKTYHRDTSSADERSQVLPTALALSTPTLLAGAAMATFWAEPLGRMLLGSAGSADLVYLSIANGLATSIAGLFFSSLRARESAKAFALLSLLQMATAMTLNIVLVVEFQLGIRGVLWGNLTSYFVALPTTALVASKGATPSFCKRLARPMLSFGLLLIPSALATWIMDLSDRYLLRIFSDLREVALYGVGYKIGMLIQLVVVWPFQLSWPAVSFSISHNVGHRETYARVLTYLVVVLVYSVLGLSFLSSVIVPALLDKSYYGADAVVPLVAMAYAFNGIYYCVSPGVHIAGYTRYTALFGGLAAAANLLLNFLFIPAWGMVGAALATVIAFAILAFATGNLGQRVYPIRYEYSRMVKAVALGLLVYGVGRFLEPAGVGMAAIWFLVFGIAAYPILLYVAGFLEDDERVAIARAWQSARRSLPWTEAE